MKSLTSVMFLGLASLAVCAPSDVYTPPKTGPSCYPTTTFGGIEVIDTQIVRDARALVEKFEPFLYKHVVRTWLFGAAEISNNATLRDSVDVEAHAVGCLLHDLGWDMAPDSPWVTDYQRFEIDGALGAKKWITEHPDGKNFDWWRLEQIQDAIRLHGSTDLQIGKSPTVQAMIKSIKSDNPGADYSIPNKQLNSIFAAFSNNDIAAGANKTFTWFAELKSALTYGTLSEQFGEAYVPGYNSTGHHTFDYITAAIRANASYVPRPE